MGNNKKLPKDPNAPKMPKRPFIYFSMEVGKDVREELSKDPSFLGHEVNFQQQGKIAKACGIRWNALSESEKEKYNMMYKEDTKRYQEEMESYTPSQEYVEKVKRAKLRNRESAVNNPNTDITKVPHMVKAYFEYLTITWPRVAAANTRLNPQQVQEEVWRRWSHGEAGGRDKRWDENRNLQKNPKKRKMNDNKSTSHGSTATQPKQAFQCFLEQMKGELRKHLPDLPYSEVVKHVSAKWTDMSQVEKEPFFALEKEEKEKSEASEDHMKNCKKEIEDKDSDIKEDFVGLSTAEHNKKNRGDDKDGAVDAQNSERQSFLKEGAEADEESSTSLVDDDFQIEDGSNVPVQKDGEEETSKNEVERAHGVNLLPPSSSSCSDDSSDDDSDTTSSESESDSD